MDTATPKSCPYTVTVRRNPPRRARATPLPQGSNIHGITPFPNNDLLSQQTPQNPSSTSEHENLKVFLRIRPFQSPAQAPQARAKTAWPKNPAKKITTSGITSTKKKSSSSCISINDSESVTLLVPSDLKESKRLKSETYGGFTHVFSSDSSQVEVYVKMVKPMVDEFIKGKSGMLAALGPSGSGKTHTVFGTPRNPGMVPLVLRHIFKETEASRSFYIAIFEIYTERGKAEKLFDLLPDGGELSMQQSTIRGQKEVLISNAEQAESLIAHAVIKRATAMTNTNSQSSRSQCIISIRDVPKKCKGVVNSKSNDAVLTIIDLAGAEREKRTGNQGTRLVESNFINNTLMVFGLCLRSLLEHQKNPKKQLQKHFQNSMLTRYLREYLEGKKRMTLLLTAKSGEDDYLDTSHLLRQASPYMQIKYNEVEPSNMVPKKRHLQPSSIIDSAKQSPSLAHLKRMRLVSEHTVQDKISGRTIGHAREWNGLYYLEEPDLSSKKDLPHSLVSVLTNKEKILLYHCRLGHPSFEIIKMLFPSFFSKLDVESLHCEVCELAKHKRVSFPMSNKISTFPFYLVHTDVWGPSNVPNVSGAKWFVTFIDDCTRVTWVYLLKHKSEVNSIFLNFHSMIKNQFGANIKRLRSDNAKDYFNNVLNSFCQKEGIIHESSCVKTPQQNGVAERKNGHLLNQTRALLFQNNVPKSFWGEAVLTATHLINRLPTRVLKSKSPMDVLASFYPWMSTTNNLKPRIFGCVSYVHIHSTNRGKLDPRALKCVFVGYSSIQKGYKCYHPSSKKFFVSRDVTFNEHESYFNQPHLQGENLREDEVTNFSLDLTFEPAGQSEQTTTHEHVESETETSHSKQSRPEIDDVRYGKNLVYSRKLKAVPDTTQVQESTHNQDPNENDEKGVEEQITSKKDTSTVCKLDASSSVSLKSECDSHSGNDRSHIIMRNFARVLWNVLKEYNSKLKVAESKILSLNESIEYEKNKNIELEKQLNEFRAACCCKGGNEKIDTEDCSSVHDDHPHNLDQEQTIDEESASELIIDRSHEELTLGTTNSELDYKESEKKRSVSSTESGHHNALEFDDVSKETFYAESSSHPRFEQSDDEHPSHHFIDYEKSYRETSVSLSNLGDHNAVEVDVVNKISSETIDAESASEPIIDQSDEEHTLCTNAELDSKESERKLSVSSMESGHHNALEVDVVSKISNETFNAESSSEPRLDQSNAEHMLCTTCSELDYEKLERKLSVSLSKPWHYDAADKIPCETFHLESLSEPTLDQSDEEHMLGSTSMTLDSEKSEREVSVPLSKPEIHMAFEVDAVRKIPKETFSAKSLSKPKIDHLDEERMLGATCTTLGSEISDREVSVSSSEPGHDNSLEVDAVSKIPSETFHTQSSSEPRLNLSNEEPTIGPCTQSASEESDSLVLCVSSSSSKSGDRNDLKVDAKSKIPSELFDSSLSTKNDVSDPSSPKDVSSTKARSDKGVNNSSCKPPRPKRTLMPSSSMLSRNLSTFDLFDESDKLKGNRSTKKLGARDDPKRSNGSISLLNLLQQRKSNIRH